jgi:hypothetical protein
MATLSQALGKGALAPEYRNHSEAASSQRTKRSSGLSTQRHSVVPAVAEPTEDELYEMPLDKLRALANQALRSPIGRDWT